MNKELSITCHGIVVMALKQTNHYRP